MCLQYTPPTAAAEYVHRVGRTARIGEKGSSLLFLTPAETSFITEMANHNIRSVERQPSQPITFWQCENTRGTLCQLPPCSTATALSVVVLQMVLLQYFCCPLPGFDCRGGSWCVSACQRWSCRTSCRVWWWTTPTRGGANTTARWDTFLLTPGPLRLSSASPWAGNFKAFLGFVFWLEGTLSGSWCF